MGLVDAVVPAEELISAARKWALDIANFRRPWIISLHKTDKLEALGEAREILKFAREQTAKRAPNLSHPLVCLDAVEEGIVSGGLAGIHKVYPVNPFCASQNQPQSFGFLCKGQKDCFHRGKLLCVVSFYCALLELKFNCGL